MAKKWGLLSLLLILGMGSALADDAPLTRSISVSGTAERLSSPDQAKLRLTVDGRGTNAATAMKQAGEKVVAVLRALESLLEPEQVQALNTNLRQVVEGTRRTWVQERGEPLEMLAEREILLERVSIGDLPTIIDAVSKEDLARLGAVTPVVSNARQVEDELQLEAVVDAKERAARIAAELGVRLGLPLSVDVDNVYRPQPRVMEAVAFKAVAADAGGGYDNAGLQTIRATIRARFELLPKN